MARRSRVSEAKAVCPQCGHAFPLDRRERDLKQQAVARVLELERAERLGELREKDRYAEAVQAAEDLLALRRRLQGADHHEAVTAQWDLAALK